MAYSFTKIQKDKSMTIGFVFFFLIFFYFLVAIGLYYVCKIYFYVELNKNNYQPEYVPLLSLSLKEIINTLVIALVVGVMHWFFSVSGIVRKIMGTLSARPLDPNDQYHVVFKNILDELSVATGGEQFQGVVVSSLALNAFALADFEGNQVIGLTEGLLSRLSRSQLEAVVAHEAAHILKGDCLETTITSSLFELYSDFLQTSTQFVESGSSGRSRGGGFIVIVYIFLSVTVFVSKLFKMFISREREYRADALAVQLTRDPLSLAEALYQISTRWRGYSLPGDGLESIFIINPQLSPLDEGEGLLSEFFSTHPPVQKRLDVLLGLAHVDMKSLQDKFATEQKVQQPAPESLEVTSAGQDHLMDESLKYYVYNDNAWCGPYPISKVVSGIARYDSWICQAGTAQVSRLFEDVNIKKYHQLKEGAGSLCACPRCQAGFTQDIYKGVPIDRCPQCYGVFLKEEDVGKLLIREDYYFSAKIKQDALRLIDLQEKCQIKSIDLKTANLFKCPQCSNAIMLRNFYTLAYPIEVDRCINCKFIWFDKNELELLQYLVENQRKKMT